MKKYIIVSFLILYSVYSLMSEQIDIIVLLDTSESMFPYYSGTIEYFIEDIVKQQLQLGDSLHLLSFNDYPEYEISKTIKGEIEIQDLIDRILLLQPFGKYTDLISAFTYLYKYVNELPPENIKKLIVLTDGIHDPPPDTNYPVSTNNKNTIVKISENIRRQGWDITLIQFPLNRYTDTSGKIISKLDGNESRTLNNLFPDIAETLGEEIMSINNDSKSIAHEATGTPEILFPANLGTVGKNFRVDFPIINHSSDPVLIKLDGILFGNINFLDSTARLKLDPGEQGILETAINLPDSWIEGVYNSPIELIFDDSIRSYPRNGVLTFYFDPGIQNIFGRLNAKIFLYIITGIIILFALVYILMKVLSSISFPSTANVSKKKDTNRFEPSNTTIKNNRYSKVLKQKRPEDIVIEMVVKNQNRHIGHRNIHLLEKNKPLSIGGAGSEYFLIFIITTGKRIGEIVLEDNIISFIPRDTFFFPDVKGSKVTNCLGKEIRVMNKDGIETNITFNKWIAPDLKLNKIMHILDNRGLPDFKY